MSEKDLLPGLEEQIRRKAGNGGIDLLGFTHAAPFGNYAWSDSVRRDPDLGLPGAESIIIAGVYIGGLTLPSWNDSRTGRTSRLYLSGFFLDVIQPLKSIKDLLEENGYRAVVCDSAHREGSVIPLKLAAVRAGLGWQGKHSLLINKTYGSYLALGGILTDAALKGEADPHPDLCRSCSKCRRACPMGALEKEFCLDYNRCLSYLLQEESLPMEAQRIMGNRVGDCEICQDACPWNRRHVENPLETALTIRFRSERKYWEELFSSGRLLKMDREEYGRLIAPLRTDIPYDIFRRNVEKAFPRL